MGNKTEQKKFKLKRPIENVTGDSEIKEVTLKDEKNISASDFYDVSFNADGSSSLGSMAETIANLFTLTSSQVASLHPKDYIVLSGEVSYFLE